MLYIQIGNFLRISGDTYHAIECFRKVIVISNNNVDALLNLARILFNLRYIKDAIYLVEHSLDEHSSEHNTWLQHFALGEYFELDGELERALSHFQMALDQNPSFHPAMINIKKLENTPIKPSSHFYTVCLIIILCICFIIYLYYYVLKEQKTEAMNNNNYQDESVTNNVTSVSTGLWRNKKMGFTRR